MSGLYNRGAQLLSTGVSWETSDIRVLLVSVAYVPDADHQTVSDVVSAGAELVGAGYARLALGGRAVTVDDAEDRALLDATDTTFPSLGAGAGTPAYAVVYHNGGLTDSDRELIGWVTLAGAGTPTGGDYLITWGELGLFVLAKSDPIVESLPEWTPLDLSAGVESDPNSYGTVSGDASGHVAFTVDAALGTVTLFGLVGATTTRPLALDVPAPADWDPATENLWLRVVPTDIDLTSGKRLGVAAGLLHSGVGTSGVGCYESSTNNASGVLITTSSLSSSQGIGTSLPGRVDLQPSILAHNGSYRMPALGVYETDAPSALSALIGAATGATALTLDPANWSVRVMLLHGNAAVAGGEVVEADIYYARVPRPTGP